ncbi:MAG TPA: NAD(P)H-hydrate epimerase, partial [Gemmatimonadaceae bacterium]|nr:NAD(P)H-hydrate epimerase [Gemmatimonadaceae bacterium]
MPVRVASAAESAALDTAAIEAGTPSRALMRVAGANAASVIAHRCAGRLRDGVTIYTGPGNNGGDGWVVARSLASAGVSVHVCETTPPKSADAIAEREAAISCVTLGEPPASGIIVDALLGTGARGALQGPIGEAVRQINAHRDRGAYIVALDVPTGLDATTGAHDENIAERVVADLTITFGTCKRGHLIARDLCGEIIVVDIGLDPNTDSRLPTLVDAHWVQSHLPPIPF